MEYVSQENGLALRDQKISMGKICYVSPTNIVILRENGELDNFSDGDFNFLEVSSFKAFKCKQLYDFIYADFKNNLNEHINKWEGQMKKSSIDSIISIFGPMDNITNISTDRKMITWKREKPVYYINLNTSSRSTYAGFQNSVANIVTNKMSSLYGISPFFLSGNSYRTTDINYSGSGSAVASSQTNQSGNIKMENQGLFLAIIQDENNKIVYVYHENIFSDPSYGQPFKFVSF